MKFSFPIKKNQIGLPEHVSLKIDVAFVITILKAFSPCLSTLVQISSRFLFLSFWEVILVLHFSLLHSICGLEARKQQRECERPKSPFMALLIFACHPAGKQYAQGTSGSIDSRELCS